MATTNKEVKSEEKPATKKVAGNEIEELKQIVLQKDNENKELRDLVKQLNSMVTEIVKSNANNSTKKSNNDDYDDDLVYINNNSIGSQIISIDRLGKTSLKILPNEVERPIEKEFLRQAIQMNTTRRLFEYGILEFCDKKFYKIYGIEQKFDMSEEKVLNLFTKHNLDSTTKLILNVLKKPDSSVLEHELFYKALDIYDRELFPAEDVATICLTLNKIFCSKVNCQFENLIGNLKYKREEYV